MPTRRQIEANRRNALKSTGPKTPAGKAKVSKNRLHHGLLSQNLLLPGEKKTDLDRLRREMTSELKPEGILESTLVDQIVASLWRLSRCRRVETELFHHEKTEGEQLELFQREDPSQLCDWDLKKRIEYLRDKLMPEGKHESMLQVGQSAKPRSASEKRSEPVEKGQAESSRLPNLARAFIRAAKEEDAFSKLSRYEAAILREMYKALHELERLQIRRLGGNVPPPLSLDVNLSGESSSDS